MFFQATTTMVVAAVAAAAAEATADLMEVDKIIPADQTGGLITKAKNTFEHLYIKRNSIHKHKNHLQKNRNQSVKTNLLKQKQNPINSMQSKL